MLFSKGREALIGPASHAKPSVQTARRRSQCSHLRCLCSDASWPAASRCRLFGEEDQIIIVATITSATITTHDYCCCHYSHYYKFPVLLGVAMHGLHPVGSGLLAVVISFAQRPAAITYEVRYIDI